MATDATNINAKPSSEPRAARRTIMAAARRVHARDGAEAFSIARVAAEAVLSPETVSAHFQNKQELLLAIAAEDLTSLAGAMREEPASSPAPKTEADNAAREEPGRLIRKKAVMPPALDQVMKEVAPEPENAGGGMVARLERRIYVLERAFADIVERHEKSLRERQNAVTAAEDSVAQLRETLAAKEKSHSETVTNLLTAMNDTRSRLNALELGAYPAHEAAQNAVSLGEATPATLPASEPVASSDPVEPPLPFETDPAVTAGEPDGRTEESYLSAARRAAIEAQLAAVASDGPGSRRKTRPAGGKSRLKFLLFGCAAPMVILAASIMVLNRHTVTAQPAGLSHMEPAGPSHIESASASLLPSAAQPVSPPPQVVVTPPVDPLPAQLASTAPLDSLIAQAQGGDVNAMRDLGLKYLAGDGTTANDPEAARWLMQAAYKGEPTAEYWLGTLYARGKGVPADAFQANHWYEAAAKGGNRRAMHSFAVANFQGWGMEKNPAEAIKWFSKAAELGFRDSQFNLAVMYERGSGVPQSLMDAYKWYAVAAADGDKEAESRLAILAGQLKPADLALAQHEAVGFKPLPMDQHANLAAPKELPGG